MSEAQIGTNQWIWTHPAFSRWLQQRSSIIWIKGKPGSRKSTLAKSFIKKAVSSGISRLKLEDVSRERPQVIVDFFYSARGGSMEMDHQLMLQSLLYQMLDQEPQLFRHFRFTFPELRAQAGGNVAWTFSDLKSVFVSLADVDHHHVEGEIEDPIPFNLLQPCDIYIVVDAIGESENMQREGRRQYDILRLFYELCCEKGRNIVKIIVMSRPGESLKRTLREADYIELERENKRDVELIVHAGLKEIWREGFDITSASPSNNKQSEPADFPSDPRQDDQAQGSLADLSSYGEGGNTDAFMFMKEYLLENADGVILWVVLVLADLQDHAAGIGTFTMKEIQQRLLRTPPNLEETYHEMIQRLPGLKDETSVAEGRLMLLWAAFAKRTLNLREFRDAMAISYVEAIDDPVSSFLNNRYRLDERNWNPLRQRMMYMCGHLLQIVRPLGYKEKSLMHVTTDRFLGHGNIQKGGDVSPHDYVQLHHQTIKEFLLRGSGAGPFNLNYLIGQTHIRTACLDYLKMSLKIVHLEDKECENWEDEDYTALFNHFMDRPLMDYTLYFLNNHFANEDPPGNLSLREFFETLQYDPKRFGWNFLRTWFYACFQQSIQKQTTLVSYQDQPLLPSADSDFLTMCMSQASQQGHPLAVQILLSAKIPIETRDGEGQTGLIRASRYGQLEVVVLLLKYRSLINAQDKTDRTALSWAACGKLSKSLW